MTFSPPASGRLTSGRLMPKRRESVPNIASVPRLRRQIILQASVRRLRPVPDYSRNSWLSAGKGDAALGIWQLCRFKRR
jgi:hypothetical protein